ncbi:MULTISPECIES: hypothetical protein [Pantoea]|uniref:hypothetical protein n=1 Tax=Pantoea TaxID=53335 RepID=UPI001596D740|nr:MULTISPECIES: hypothetical protein [Pantoea]
MEEKLIEAIKAQTEAITRLAESNESLVAVIYDSLIAEEVEHATQTYLNGKPRG